MRAVFLDRDGVINTNVLDLVDEKKFVFMQDTVPKAIRLLNDAGYLVIIVTNQPIIAKGMCTFDQMEKLHNKMKALLKKEGAKIDDIFMCPHHPQKGFPGEVVELKIDCNCRKPKPGLILEAALKHKLDLKKSWMIGDSPSDILAGETAGVKTILVNGGGSLAAQEKSLKATPVATKQDLLAAVQYILSVKS